MRAGQWRRGVSYHAANWNAIERVWKLIFDTDGLYERLAWSCEYWAWSFEEGYEPYDYI